MTAKALDSGHRAPMGPGSVYCHGHESLSDPMAPVRFREAALPIGKCVIALITVGCA